VYRRDDHFLPMSADPGVLATPEHYFSASDAPIVISWQRAILNPALLTR